MRPEESRDLSKLPKWAQRHIETLERNLAHERARLAEGPESDTFADPHASPPLPLGTGTWIRFVLDENDYLDAYVDRGALVVMGSRGYLAIRPQSANVARLDSSAPTMRGPR